MSQSRIIRSLKAQLSEHEKRFLPEPVLFNLWIQSFRYCLPRASYAVGDFCDNYRAYYDAISDRAKELIERELAEAISDGLPSSSHDCDENEWKTLYNWVLRQNNPN